jgi:hypothetical protein
MKKCVQQWSNTFTLATVVDTSYEVQHHAARDVAKRCPPSRPLHTSRAMREAPRKGGVGREVGAGFTASSSRTKWFRTTSDEWLVVVLGDIPISLIDGWSKRVIAWFQQLQINARQTVPLYLAQQFSPRHLPESPIGAHRD